MNDNIYWVNENVHNECFCTPLEQLLDPQYNPILVRILCEASTVDLKTMALLHFFKGKNRTHFFNIYLTIYGPGLFLVGSHFSKAFANVIPAISQPLRCGTGDIAPVNIQAEWRVEESCFDLQGIIYNV